MVDSDDESAEIHSLQEALQEAFSYGEEFGESRAKPTVIVIDDDIVKSEPEHNPGEDDCFPATQADGYEAGEDFMAQEALPPSLDEAEAKSPEPQQALAREDTEEDVDEQIRQVLYLATRLEN